MAIVDYPVAPKGKGKLFFPGRRLYLNKAGEAVEAKDPSKVTLLCNEHGGIPMAQALALGLVKVEEPIVTATEPEVAEISDKDKRVGELKRLNKAQLSEIATGHELSLENDPTKAVIVGMIVAHEFPE